MLAVSFSEANRWELGTVNPAHGLFDYFGLGVRCSAGFRFCQWLRKSHVKHVTFNRRFETEPLVTHRVLGDSVSRPSQIDIEIALSMRTECALLSRIPLNSGWHPFRLDGSVGVNSNRLKR